MCLLFAQRLSKPIPISRIVRLCIFLLFLPIFMHRYTALSQKSEVPIWVFRFFQCYNGTWNELQIYRAACCWVNLGERSGGPFDSKRKVPSLAPKRVCIHLVTYSFFIGFETACIFNFKVLYYFILNFFRRVTMKLVTPSFYKDFKCIAGDCPDSCCQGWEVDADEDSLEIGRASCRERV